MRALSLIVLVAVVCFAGVGIASTGDQLYEFKQCLDVCLRFYLAIPMCAQYLY